MTKLFFAVVDCTGHGVPGAFVSLIAHNALNKVVLENQITTPSIILDELNVGITNLFEKSDRNIRDGMDIGLCCWDKTKNTFQYAGAYISLFLMRKGSLTEIKANRESIGASIFKHKKEFVNHDVEIESGDMLYMSSDGFPDQFGGVRRKKMKWKGFKNMLLNLDDKTMEHQQKTIQEFFSQWKGKQEQLDDVCVMGVRI